MADDGAVAPAAAVAAAESDAGAGVDEAAPSAASSDGFAANAVAGAAAWGTADSRGSGTTARTLGCGGKEGW